MTSNKNDSSEYSGNRATDKVLVRLLNIHEMLNIINDALLRAGNQRDVFESICEAAVGQGGFGLAVVGLLDASGREILVHTWKGISGIEPADKTSLADFLSMDKEIIQRAVVSGTLITVDNHRLGNRAVSGNKSKKAGEPYYITLIPFRSGGRKVGIFCLLSEGGGIFAENELKLFRRLAENISFALEMVEGESRRRENERRIKQSEEQYHSVFENTTVGMYRTTPGGKILLANTALIQMLGYSSLAELQERDLQKAGFEPDYPRSEFVSRIDAYGKIIGLEAAWTRKDGRVIYVRESARSIQGPDGKTLYYEGVVEDITERIMAEQNAREKTILLDEMSRMAKIGGWEFNTSDLKGTWTEETARIHGLDPALPTNAEFGLSFYSGEHRARIESAVKEAIEKAKAYDLELEVTAADGMRKWIRTVGHPVIEGGKVVKIRGTFQDITESKRANDRIWYLTRLYATLSQVNQTIVRTKSRDDLYRAICEIGLQFGEFPLVAVGSYNAQDHLVELKEWKGVGILGKPYSVIDIRLPQYVDGLLSAAIRSGKVMTSRDVPSMLETKHWAEILMKHGLNAAAAVPFRLKGEIVGVLTFYARDAEIFVPEAIELFEEMGLDISFALDSMEADQERWRNEKALADERDRISMVAETVPGLIHSYRQRPDGSACMPYASPAIKEIYGYLPEDVVNDLSPVFAHFHPEDVDHIYRTIAESARTMALWHDEFRYLHPVKGEVWIEGRSMPVREADGSITWHGFIQDVTERKRAERALRDSEDRFRSIMNQMTDTVFLSNSDGVIEYVSPSCEAMFGFKAEEMVGNHFKAFLHEEAIELAIRTFRKTQGTGEPTKNLELKMKRKNGTHFLGELDAALYRNDDARGSIGVIRDITSRKKAEEELRKTEARRSELEMELIQAQKLESLGTLAGGIAHDFNNILGVIMGYSALLSEGEQEPANVTRGIEAIEKASERGAAIVKQLLTFARKTETVFIPVSISDVINETVRFLSETFPKTIIISTSVGKDLPRIIGDHSQLNQVMMNLCINARDAMPHGGSVQISAGIADRAGVSSRFSQAENRDYVILSVADTGIGMDAETKRKVFDPFFTTKGPGKGTGLGLALVYSIVQNHGGFIGVESKPGHGTTFEIYLPAVGSDESQVNSLNLYRASELVGSETILVIEDEQMLLELLYEILVPRGYKVLVAHDGEEGLEIFARHKKDIAAVITDLGLPKLGGEQVYRRIKSLRPDAKVVIASGFIDPDLRQSLIDAGAEFFIQKPYVPVEILETIRASLDPR